MPNIEQSIKNVEAARYKKSLKKAKRLVEGRPKWSDEKVMDQKQREEYIDWFLTGGKPKGKLEDMDIDIDKAKLMTKMYELKSKTDKNGEDISLAKLKGSSKAT